MFKRNLTIAALALAPLPLFLSSNAAANEPLLLDELVVSGGLTPVPVKEYGRASTVITSQELQDRQTVHLVDVLRTVPGVAVNRTGAAGGFTQVRIRGNEGNQTLVLIDGVEANSIEGGEYDFGGLIAADIERIEVLRGPQSSFYGSNAVGGVISIITKRATEPGVTVGGSLEGGTDTSVGGSAFVRAATDKVRFSFAIAGQRVGGFDTSADPGGEQDEDRNITVNSRIDGAVTEALTVGGAFRMTDRRSDTDPETFGAPDKQSLVFDRDDGVERREIFGSIFADLALLGGRVETRTSVDYLLTDNKRFTSGVRSSDDTGDRLGASAQATVALDAATVADADHTFSFAGEFQRETFRNNDAALVFDPSQLATQSRNLFGIIAEYRGTFFDRLDLQGSIRHDFNDDFEDTTTFAVGASYRLEVSGSRLHASAGSGVQNPTFFEQFGFIPGRFNGNPNLKPEKSMGFDVGVEQQFWGGKAVVDVTYFFQELEDEIFTNFPPPTFIGTPFNDNGDSRRQGVELKLNVYPTDGLSIGVNYTYLDAKDFDGGREVRRPRHEGGIVANYRFFDNRASVTADARFVADNFDSDFRNPSFGAQDVKLGDYAVVNLSGSFDVNENVQVYGRVNNLFDTNYEEVFGYATQGLTGYAGVRLRF